MLHPIYFIALHCSKSFLLTRSAYGLTTDTEQTINFRPILAGELYGPLRDLTVFNQVRIDPEVSPWCGPTEPTLILPHCTIGRLRNRLFERSLDAGSRYRREPGGVCSAVAA